MFNKILLFTIALNLPAMASAEIAPKTEQRKITWSATTGLGYDSNAFQDHNAPYLDYAAPLPGTPVTYPTVSSQAKSGFFVPYQIKVDMANDHYLGSRLLGSAIVDGNFYLGNDLGNANEFKVELHGGYEYILVQNGSSAKTLYVGALLETDKHVYVDHDAGLEKSTTLSGIDIPGRYSYRSYGVEAKYKHSIDAIDYGFTGQYLLNDYEKPSQLDHSYYSLGANASVPLDPETRLKLTLDHSARDYSNTHSRNASGTSILSNPLQQFTYNAVGAVLRKKLSPDWLLFLDFDNTRRADAYVSYDDYRESILGARLLYEQDAIKARFALHHWGRDYPNGLAFDAVGHGAKTYSGNALEVKAEMEQADKTKVWTELIYKVQNATDMRYDFARAQIMAGMSWAY